MRKVFIIIALILVFTVSLFSQDGFPFRDTSLSIDERIDDLISRLVLEEKASLMLYNSPAIERLGIPEYNWWNECLHGVGRAGKATVFPQAIGLAATFDEDLIYRVANAISDEARAKHHLAVSKGLRGQYAGLTFWTPNINIFRDPRWGRGQETYGEDPFLTSRIGVAFVNGLQGDDPKYLKTSACAKHYVVHSGPEESRHHFNALPNDRDFRETYLPGFKALVDAGVESIMCAYNRTYEEPCCGSKLLLIDILRDEWGFQGHIVSDCWALDDIWARHKVVEKEVEAAAMAAEAGVNLNCGYVYKFLPEAVENGLVSEDLLDENLKVLLKTRFRLGLFDPDEANTYSTIPVDIVNCDEHRELALEAASASVVLLKNDNILPIKKDTVKRILILGPTAADITSLYGNYNGFSGNMQTFLEGMLDRADEGTVVEYNQGFLFHNDTLFHGFWQASRADVVVACIGINSLYEGEEGDAMLNKHGGDRIDIALPPNQVEYIRILRERNKNKPMVVVVTGGSAIAMPEIDSLADAILFAWYPGEQGGNAVADIIFGDVNPSGRLPVTFYKSVNNLPPFEDYNMKGRTYKYFEGDALYPFGHGLSYTEFHYYDLNTYLDNGIIVVDFSIRNAGGKDGSEVAQVYVKDLNAATDDPIRTLKGFKRIGLDRGESKSLTFEIPLEDIAYWNVDKQKFEIKPGKYSIQVGASSADIRIEKEIMLD